MDIHLGLLPTWQKLSKVTGGRILFSQLLGRIVPYTGSVRPIILELRPGFAKVEVKDRRAIRNHLRSIHAAALMNVAEVASGLALNVSLPKNARAILAGFNIEYKKKARGTLTAECILEPVTSNTKTEHLVVSTVRDVHGDVVALAHARWLVSPRK